MAFNLWEWLAEAGEDIGDLLTHPILTIPRKQAKELARKYHLGDDDEAFEELWGLTILAMLSSRESRGAAVQEVTRELDLLRTLVDRAPIAPTSPGRPVAGLSDDGFRKLQVASTDGRYVIFS